MTNSIDYVYSGFHWGSVRVKRIDGQPTELQAAPFDANPSEISQGTLSALNAKCRITSPMVRKSFLAGDRSTPCHLRGREPFVKVSWEVANQLVCDELTRVRGQYGNEAIYAGSYGWASAGRFHHAPSHLRRFLNLFGGFTRSVNTYSYAAAEVILPHVIGPLPSFLRNHISWTDITENTDLVVAFGGLAAKNAQVDSGGVGSHDQQDDMRAAKAAKTQFVNVSPLKSDTIPELDAEWLAIKPGTDVALMLGLAHTLIVNNSYNQEFLQCYCTGFEPFRRYVLGLDDGCAKSAEWAACIVGIPAQEIARLALRMANSKTLITASWSLTRQQNGEHTYWMSVVLAAMLGQIGLPGRGIAFGLAAVNSVGNKQTSLDWASLPQGTNPVDAFIPVARISDMLLNPGGHFQYNGSEYSFPDIRLVYWVGGNPFHHHQDLNRLMRAWQRPETVIVHEQWWTSTAKNADIVLPANVALERSDLICSPRNPVVVAAQVAVESKGKALSDYDIFANLADGLGFRQAYTEGRTSEDWIKELYERSRHQAKLRDLALPTYDDLVKDGYYILPPTLPKPSTLENFRRDARKFPLSTPSGLIEVFSSTIAAFGYENHPGHPIWTDPDEWVGENAVQNYPLHLISNQPSNKLHSQMDHGPNSRSNKVAGHEPCYLNSVDAEKRGIKEGERVRIFNNLGSCISSVRISSDIRPGTIILPTGAWLDARYLNANDASQTCLHGNPNILTSDKPTSQLSQGPAAMTCRVEVESFNRNLPEIRAFCPPEIEQSG